MERYMYLWRGPEKILYTFGDQPSGLICRLVTVKDHVFVSTTTNNLYHGVVATHLESETCPLLTFKRVQFYAMDIATNSDYLFIVNDAGQVLRIDPSDMTHVETITLREEPKSCSHGYKADNESVKVKSLAASDNAMLFIAENGQLWANGDQPQIDIKTSEPKKVTFFDGRIVSSVACGANFNVALVRKIIRTMKDDTDSENDLEEEVFVSSCPHCVSDVMLSPVSQPSTDTCPLGLHVRQSSEDRSTNSTSAPSTASKDHDNALLLDDEKRFDDLSKTLTNGDNFSDGLPIELQREEKKNVIFINTEAARQFLTRQLSWVSSYGNAGEELLAECADRPTRIIKQNVSNMASLVYEGVKTVGDKVVTLSRHMSGSSDNNEAQDSGQDGLEDGVTGDTKPTATSLANSLRCEEFPWSSSAGTSDRELSEQGLNERINTLVRAGNSLLSTELWTWGDIQYGQLGTGDTTKRPRPILVEKFHNLGIKKIVCGSYHVLALTLDGRAYAWGRNNSFQVTPQSPTDQSSPRLFSCGPSSSQPERVRDMAAGENHTLIMTSTGLQLMGKYSLERTGEIIQIKIPDAVGYSAKQILSSGSYSCCTMINQPACDISSDLTNEQIFLEEMLMVYQNLIKPFQKKGGATQESNVYETLCQCYTELISFTSLNVLSLWDYYDHNGEAYEVVVVASIEEYITVYKHYLNAICDVVSLGGFTHIARIIDVPQTLISLFMDKVKGSKSKKANNEAIIALALQHPLNRLNRYKAMVHSLIRINGPKLGIERLQEALGKWEQICDEQERRLKEAETTKQFWESSGKLVELLRSPDRRLIRESRTHPISVLNCGRFSTHWFVLLTDILIHVNGTSHTVHPLPTLWVEPLQDTDAVQHVAWRKLTRKGLISNALSVTTPEDSLVLYTPTPAERTEWLQALQTAIKRSLLRVVGHVPPLVRSSSFSFTKHSLYKDAKYTGRWLNGKPHGTGKLEWSDGRMYVGHFHRGIMHGTGKMEIPTQGIYEGQWKDGQQNGYGTMKYINGDIYEGHFKDSLPHGHGIKKEGHFMASVASIYIGEWVAGLKQGYGVMDDITTGEKYLGLWNNNMKHGCGLIVTLDGIYYEGVFMQDILTGHGVMIFEDGTHYEGEFRSAGVFSGKGTLTFSSGDKIEGNMNGAWNEGVKITATLHMNVANCSSHVNAKPTSFGKLCVPPDQKWKAIFRQCYQQLGVSEPGSKNNSTANKIGETQRVWQNVAVVITNSHQDTIQRRKDIARDLNSSSSTCRQKDRSNINQLEKIPQFGWDSLNLKTYDEVHDYLIKAFESLHHPLGTLLTEVAAAYTATYGGVRVHPLLLSHAVAELHSITSRIYHVVTLLFPALPPGGQELILETEDSEESKVVSAAAILHPILLPRVHSALFVLYALHNKKEDDAYWKRLMKWNKQPDITLMAFLGIDPKFWKSATTNHIGEHPLPNDAEQLFGDAVETLQQLKTTFSPLEKLLVIRNTFEQMTQVVQRQLGSTYLWTMDELFPVFHFVVVRARVLQLGSEINFIEDFMEPYLQNGELGIMFTTLKACYYQILQEKMSMSN
ncbi:alsin isoform X2 [Neodiprion lecontei]|uniref:Alsin isoform X2 n=1 Tax=Neodiprion lecontei TaxID=441921 RepID=A0A6J0BLU4_NEOLC|nr:alsin isoform X2 [Neodiprion lecontei]